MNMENSTPVRYYIHFALIGLFAGISYHVSQAIGLEDRLLWFIMALTLMLLLAWPAQSLYRLILPATALSIVFALAYNYTETAAPLGLIYNQKEYIYILMAYYLSLSFYLVYVDENRFVFPYKKLYLYSWNSIVIFVFATLFTIVVWVISRLTATLFDDINLPYLLNIVNANLYYELAIPVYFALGCGIARVYSKIIDSLRKLLFAMCYYLLPLLAVVGLVYFIALIFSVLVNDLTMGVDSKNFDIFILLIILSIFLINAVYQDGEQDKLYSTKVGWVIKSYIIISPIFVAILLVSIVKIISTYGFSPKIFIKLILAGLILLYAISYSIASLFKKNNSLPLIKKVNPSLAVLVICTFTLICTPLLNPYQISVNRQIAKLKAGKILNKKSEYPYSIIYLVGADLRGLDLRRQVLASAYLDNADLRGANLSHANLSHANLRSSKMKNALLENTRLDFANLKGAFGLTQEQLSKACGRYVKLPRYLESSSTSAKSSLIKPCK